MNHGLLRHGVRIFEYQPRFMHQKVVLCDHWATIGSTNLDRWNLRWNLEVNQETPIPRVRARGTGDARRRFPRRHVEYRFGEWRRRPWYARALLNMPGAWWPCGPSG